MQTEVVAFITAGQVSHVAKDYILSTATCTEYSVNNVYVCGSNPKSTEYNNVIIVEGPLSLFWTCTLELEICMYTFTVLSIVIGREIGGRGT